ncbi:MAG: tRNA adenosine(34) deaminase TadA [Nitrospirae bacterium]|nr:tRNA adenosine(34) deaminase TadA [Nitrospirota bacterium]
MNETDEYYMEFAIREAEKAMAKEEVPVGAVLVRDGEVIASAHNLRETANDPTAHAELLAIREGAIRFGSWRLTDSTLYVTKEPCVMCAGAMVNARLGRLVYGCGDSRFGASESIYHITSDPRLNHSVEVKAGVLEDECANILKRFFAKLRVGKAES